VRCGLSSVYGFRRGLELDVLGDGGGGWLKSVSLAQKLIIIESACARVFNLQRCLREPQQIFIEPSDIVGSYPTRPVINFTPPVDSGVFKALWSVRTLDEHTIRGYRKLLRVLINRVNLDDPLSVEKYILGLRGKNKYKNNLLSVYSVYCKANGIQWNRPVRLRNEQYPIKVPTEERIDLIISCSTLTYSTVFSISKYGRRPDEVGKITLRDLDLERRTLTVRTSKLGLTEIIQPNF